MTITVEQIQDRFRLLSRQKEELVSQLNATIGALNDCEYWLSLAEKKDSGDSNGSS